MMSDQVKANVGDLLNGTAGEIRSNKDAVLKYMAIFIILGTISGYLDLSLGLISDQASQDWQAGFDYGPVGMIVLIASVVGQFWLFGKMLGAEVELSGANSARIFAFIGLAIVTGVAVLFVTVFLILPGLFLGARWLMSPAFFVNDQERVFDALGKSWEATKGNTRVVVLASVILLLGFVLLTVVLGLATLLDSLAIEAFVGAVLSEAFSVILVAFSVATFRKLLAGSVQVAQVFE